MGRGGKGKAVATSVSWRTVAYYSVFLSVFCIDNINLWCYLKAINKP